MKKYRRALRDKYLPALLIAVLSSLCINAQVYQSYNQFGGAWKRLSSDSTAHVPYGPSPSLNGGITRPGALFFNTTDSTLNHWTGHNWFAVLNFRDTAVTVATKAWVLANATGKLFGRDDALNESGSAMFFDNDGQNFTIGGIANLYLNDATGASRISFIDDGSMLIQGGITLDQYIALDDNSITLQHSSRLSASVGSGRGLFVNDVATSGNPFFILTDDENTKIFGDSDGLTAESDTITVKANDKLHLISPNIFFKVSDYESREPGDYLSLLDAATGEMQWQSPPINENISNTDLTLDDDRTLSGDGHSLRIEDVEDLNFEADSSWSASSGSRSDENYTGITGESNIGLVRLSVRSDKDLLLSAGDTLRIKGGNNPGALFLDIGNSSSASTGDVLTLIDPLTGESSWQTPTGGGGGSSVFSDLTAATGSNTIDNTTNTQTWKWDGLAGGTGLELSSASTAAASNASKLLTVSTAGANANADQTTYGIDIANTHTGTNAENIGIRSNASGGTFNYGFKSDILSAGGRGLFVDMSAADGSALYATVDDQDYIINAMAPGSRQLTMRSVTSGSEFELRSANGNLNIVGSTGKIVVSTNSTNNIQVNPGGNLGLGSTTSPTSKVHIGGSVAMATTTITGNTTLDNTHYTVRADATGGNISIALPTASTCTGRVYIIKKIDASANTVTITGTVDGGSQVISTRYAGYGIQSNGTDWDIIQTL